MTFPFLFPLTTARHLTTLMLMPLTMQMFQQLVNQTTPRLDFVSNSPLLSLALSNGPLLRLATGGNNNGQADRRSELPERLQQRSKVVKVPNYIIQPIVINQQQPPVTRIGQQSFYTLPQMAQQAPVTMNQPQTPTPQVVMFSMTPQGLPSILSPQATPLQTMTINQNQHQLPSSLQHNQQQPLSMTFIATPAANGVQSTSPLLNSVVPNLGSNQVMFANHGNDLNTANGVAVKMVNVGGGATVAARSESEREEDDRSTNDADDEDEDRVPIVARSDP